MTRITPGALVLSDGAVFEGEFIGATAGQPEPNQPDPSQITAGEVVFNTTMYGYQEVISDPSYAGQIITFTYPHIGNYGTTAADNEASRPHCRGVIIRDLARRHSNWRAQDSLQEYLAATNLAAIAGIDTRRLTRHIREHGAMPGAFGPVGTTPAEFATATAALKAAAQAEPGTTGVNLVSQVTTPQPYKFTKLANQDGWRVVAFDLGIKAAIVAQLGAMAQVEVVPASTTADEVLEREPHGVFLSNGPGDPELIGPLLTELPTLLEAVPVFGICLGQQALALALGGRSYKMKFGHHGGNVPVLNKSTGAVEITSQNHNFAVEADSVPGVTQTHICLNDDTLEGFSHDELPAFAVQYHPEASPGPHDARYLFNRFDDLMRKVHGSPTKAGGRNSKRNKRSKQRSNENQPS